MPEGEFFFLATLQARHHIIVGIVCQFVKTQCIQTDGSVQLNREINWRRGRCDTDRHGWSIRQAVRRSRGQLSVSGSVRRRVTVRFDRGGTAKWLADIFNPWRQEAQIIFKQKKKLIMSSLLWLMIKDNYFFIPLAKAEYVLSHVAT